MLSSLWRQIEVLKDFNFHLKDWMLSLATNTVGYFPRSNRLILFSFEKMLPNTLSLTHHGGSCHRPSGTTEWAGKSRTRKVTPRVSPQWPSRGTNEVQTHSKPASHFELCRQSLLFSLCDLFSFWKIPSMFFWLLFWRMRDQTSPSGPGGGAAPADWQ